MSGKAGVCSRLPRTTRTQTAAVNILQALDSAEMQIKRSFETIVALGVIAVLFGFIWKAVISVKPEISSAPPMDLGPVGVTVLDLEATAYDLTVDAYGTLAPLRRLAISVEGAGRIDHVSPNWKMGAIVPAGELLISLDATRIELAVQMAVAQLAQSQAAAAAAKVELQGAAAIEDLAREARVVAHRELNRVQDLFEKGVASEQLIDQAHGAEIAASQALEQAVAAQRRSVATEVTAGAAVDVAFAALEQARDGLTRLSFTTPFAGRLTSAAPEIGGLITLGAPAMLGELLDTSSLLLVAQVHEDQLSRLLIGQRAQISFPSRGELVIEGKVRQLGVFADPLTRSLPVELVIGNDSATDASGLGLPAGLFAAATIDVGREQDALVIDRKHLVWIEGRPTAYVIGVGQNGEAVAEQRFLNLGDTVGEGFLVLDGLANGEVLLTSPLDRLAPRKGGEPTPIIRLDQLREDLSKADLDGASSENSEL